MTSSTSVKWRCFHRVRRLRLLTIRFVVVRSSSHERSAMLEEASLAGDHPAVVRVSNDSVVSLSVFLRKRGGPSAASVRGVGQ
eukprot:4372596-Amphidinium_carterae.3